MLLNVGMTENKLNSRNQFNPLLLMANKILIASVTRERTTNMLKNLLF